MNRLRVQEIATARGVNLSQLHAAVNARRVAAGVDGVALGTMRRYWHGTKTGSVKGQAIDLVDLNLLVTIARVLDVPVGELMNEDVLGPEWATADAA